MEDQSLKRTYHITVSPIIYSHIFSLSFLHQFQLLFTESRIPNSQLLSHHQHQNMQSLSLRCEPEHVDGPEPAGDWIRLLINDSPIVVLSRKGCFMCHVMRRLLASIGAHPTVIELNEAEAAVAAASLPVLFVGGKLVGGLEGLVALHLSGALVPRLEQAGAIRSY